MNISPEILNQLGLSRNETIKPRNELGQTEFLKLMTTQLNNQDPFKPMESGEFLGQIAQFSTVTGIQDLQSSFSDFAASVSSEQALQAANLVGRTVLVSGSEGLLAAGGELEGELTVPQNASSVSVDILDSNGELVRQIDLGSQLSGQLAFSWDGVTSDGHFADPGAYQVRANAVVGGSSIALESQVRSVVESVTLGRGGSPLIINTAALGAVSFSDVYQIL